MTYEEREEIFSKEYISIKDIEALFGMSYDDASKKIREIKRGIEFSGKKLRLNVQGKLHVQDYLDYYGLGPERYVAAPRVVEVNGMTMRRELYD